MFIKKKIYKTACKETWSVAKPGVATDYAGHTGFFWQESVLLFHSRPKASTNFQPDLVFQRLTWLGPSRPFCSRNIGWWHSPTYQVTYLLGGRMKVHHLMSIRPLECWLPTLNARVVPYHLPQCFIKALRFLLARLQGHSFQSVFQLVFRIYTLQLPSCVLPTAFNTFCSQKLGILTGRSWNFSDISSDISAPRTN